MKLTEEDDRVLRDYAKRLHYDLGEEAYHNVICNILSQGKWGTIVDIRGFCIVATKYALYKIFRHEASERQNIEAYINGDPTPMQVGLTRGHERYNVRQARCRKGLHELIEGNLVYIGVRRTCRACKQARERKI